MRPLLLFSRSVMSDSLQSPWTAAYQACLSITISWSLFKLKSMELVMPSNHLILCHPFLPPSICPSIRVFSNESALHIRWSKYWSFSISPSNEYLGLIPLGLTGLIFSLSQDNYNITKNKLPFLSKDNGIIVNMCG